MNIGNCVMFTWRQCRIGTLVAAITMKTFDLKPPLPAPIGGCRTSQTGILRWPTRSSVSHGIAIREQLWSSLTSPVGQVLQPMALDWPVAPAHAVMFRLSWESWRA